MLADIKRFHVQPIGETVTIPNDDVARLMYYLSCVDTVIEHDNTDDMLTDYENYDLLNVNQLTVLFSLVTLFDPKIFINGGIFILDPLLVPEGSDNEFYQITDERVNFHFNDEIMIGGKICKILKVMVCNTSWLLRFYYNPLKNIMSLAEKPLPPPKSFYISNSTYESEQPVYMTKTTNMTYPTYTPPPAYSSRPPTREAGKCCLIY